MWTKKIAVWSAAGILLASLAVIPVSATASADAICEECKVANCTQTGYHVHDKKIYCGYTHNNGHHNAQTSSTQASSNSSSSSSNNSSSSMSNSCSSVNAGSGHHGGHRGGHH